MDDSARRGTMTMESPSEMASACGAMAIGLSMMMALVQGIGSAGHDSTVVAAAAAVVVGKPVALTK